MHRCGSGACGTAPPPDGRAANVERCDAGLLVELAAAFVRAHATGGAYMTEPCLNDAHKAKNMALQ